VMKEFKRPEGLYNVQVADSVQIPTPGHCVPVAAVEHTCAQPRCVPGVFHTQGPMRATKPGSQARAKHMWVHLQWVQNMCLETQNLPIG
jgi:hypothetical protein